MTRGLLLVALMAMSGKAFAQVDLVDPDVKPAKKRAPPKPKPKPDEVEGEGDLTRQPLDLKPGEQPDIAEPAPDEEEPEKPAAPEKPVKKAPEKKPEAPVEKPRPQVAPIAVPRHSDADFDAAWEKWRAANANQVNDPKAEAQARAELVSLKTEAGAANLETWSVAMLRAAEAHEERGSSAAAVDLALTAVELAPDLPAPQFGLARAYFEADPSEVPRYFLTVKAGVTRLLADPRSLRPVIADLIAAVLLALAITGVLVVIVLLARRLKYFLFDVHFFFPRAVPRWQSSAMGLLFLTLPIVFRWGLVPSLLFAFLAMTLYLTLAERVVATVLIACIGMLPVLAPFVVRATAFADTPAELAWQLEAGGSGAEAIAQRVAKRAAEDKAQFGELFALGTFELHRGKLDLAVPRLKAALLKQPGEPRAQVNLAVAMLLSGDLENPFELLETAGACSRELGCNRSVAPTELAAPWYDLARLYQRRVATFGVEKAATEIDKGNAAMAEAKTRDASLAERKDADKPTAGTYLMTLPMAKADLLALTVSPEAEARVRSQLTQVLLGDRNEPWAPLYPLSACLLLIALGGLSFRVGAARACGKCGNAMSQRDDPTLSPGSNLCTQCVNVFSKKGVVPAALKVRKQVEVARFTSRMDRISFGLGIVCSGLGHVFKGLPVRGALYAFLFLFAAVAFWLRDGVMRTPFEGVPLWLKVLPIALLFLGVYGLSLRALFKKQGV
jgi:tetratricopeptide (TPR) repeat protein